MKRIPPIPPSRAAVDGANAMTRALLSGPRDLCPRRGVIRATGQIIECRYGEGHASECYWQAHGAIPLVETPAWVTARSHESTALPPWYDDAVPVEDTP